MIVITDDDMVYNRCSKQLTDLCHTICQGNIIRRRRKVSTRVVMKQHDRSRIGENDAL